MAVAVAASDEVFYLAPAIFAACLAIKYLVWGLRVLADREPEGAAELREEIAALKLEAKIAAGRRVI